PLSLAYPELARGEARIGERLRLIMQNSRLRLVHMAGPEATFTWWGQGEHADAFLTAYAYYADWHASRAVAVELPAEHWQRVLDLYAQQAPQVPLLQRALILGFARDMQLPTETLLKGLLADLGAADEGEELAPDDSGEASLVMAYADSRLGRDLARVLAADLAGSRVALPARFAAGLGAARERVAASSHPFAEAVRLSRGPLDPLQINALLQRLTPAQATLERALALTWLQRRLG